MTLLALRPRPRTVATYRLPVGRAVDLALSAVDDRGHPVDPPVARGWQTSDPSVVALSLAVGVTAVAITPGVARVTASTSVGAAVLDFDTTTPALPVELRVGEPRRIRRS